MDTLLIVLGGGALIALIVWWFFGKHDTSKAHASMSAEDGQTATVAVSGGYTPNTVVFKQGLPAQIIFDRKDPSSCFNEVVFPDFGVHETLPIGQPHTINIDTTRAGEYAYACGMNMFYGKVIVK